MAKPESSNIRTVIEPFAEFKSPSSSSSSFIRSLALSTVSDSQTLIYAGTVSGNLLLLSLDPSQTPNEEIIEDKAKPTPRKISFVRYVTVSTCSIDSIHVISEIEKVLVISDGLLYFVDSFLLQPLKKLSALKGISAVGRRIRSGEPNSFTDLQEVSSVGSSFLQKLGSGIRSNGVKSSGKESELLNKDHNCVFAAVCGKRLMLIGHDSSESNGGSVLILKEMQCVDMVKTVVWVDDSIIVGNFSGYYLYSCVTGQCALLFSLPDPITSPPQLKLLRKDWKLLLLVDNVGVTVNAQGQPVGGSLVFRHAPDSLAEIGTYVVVMKNGKMELYHKKSGYCIQTISFAGEGVGPFVVADDEDGNRKLVAVAIQSKVC